MKTLRMCALIVLLLSMCLLAPSPSATASPVRLAITRLSVTTGPSAGGTTVRIIGRHFTRRTRVLFGGAVARSHYRNSRTLIVVSPAHAAGTVVVRARTRHLMSRVTTKTHFTYVAAPTPATPRPVWASVSSGGGHTCAVRTDHTLWCWGANDLGQLGTTANSGSETPNPTPTQVGSDRTWSSVATGEAHTCGTRTDHTLWCWGHNHYGQLGTTTNVGTDVPSPTPVQVGTATWESVATGGYSTCALRTDGTAWCWGLNTYGQLGVATNAGTYAPNATPTQVVGGPWRSLAVSFAHTCGTRTDGTLWCWGSNYSGQLGITTNSGSIDPNPTPGQVGTGSTWTTVTAGGSHTCATRTDGTLWCWGSNSSGQLGSSANAGTSSPNPTPAQVAIAGWSGVAAGSSHTCGTRTDGTLWCWGENPYGELGDSSNLGTLNPNPTPVRVGSATTWSELSSGRGGTCALRTDGTLWCWGANHYGQLGNPANAGTETPNPTPAEVPLGN